MLPSPAVVTMNSELQVLQKYLFPDSLANSIPLIVGLSHYSFTRWGGQPESAALSPLSQFDSRSSGWPAHAMGRRESQCGRRHARAAPADSPVAAQDTQRSNLLSWLGMTTELTTDQSPRRRLPPWFKVPMPGGDNYRELQGLLRDSSLHTVCEEARCPNIGECWERRSATFMVLGDICTRRCHYCAVTTGRPLGLDLQEPARLARAVERLALRYCVITSVNRDDLPGRRSLHLRPVHPTNPSQGARLRGRGADS